MLITAAACLLAVVLLGVLRRAPTSADTALRDVLTSALAGDPDLLRLLVLPSEPVVLLPVVAVIAGCCALQRRWPAVVFAVLAPVVAVAVNSGGLKPLFRWISDGALSYPSGHTASLAAVVVVLAVLARGGTATWVAAAVGVLLTAAAGIGMVVLGYHYPGDIVGGGLAGAAVVLAAAAVVLRTTLSQHPAQ